MELFLHVQKKSPSFGPYLYVKPKMPNYMGINIWVNLVALYGFCPKKDPLAIKQASSLDSYAQNYEIFIKMKFGQKAEHCTRTRYDLDDLV